MFGSLALICAAVGTTKTPEMMGLFPVPAYPVCPGETAVKQLLYKF